jgi:hypothetical protein
MRRPVVASTRPWLEIGLASHNERRVGLPTPPDVDSSAHVTGAVLLMVGYPLALGVLGRLRPVLAERRVWWFVVLEAATAGITAGWLLRRRPLPAVVNGAAVVGFAIAWWITGRSAGLGAENAR